jgi:hypothetical protein
MTMNMIDMAAMIVYIFQEVSFFMPKKKRYEERMLVNNILVITI